tara:strand:+ start:382 stop:1050 length:669 start_codon:yes stop_codon:yes gene_type:complete
MQIKKKFLKNFLIQELLGLITAIYIYFVRLTSSIKYENIIVPEKFWNNEEPFILAFWHSQLMMIGYSWKSKKRINILASGHSDGRFGSVVGKYFKLNNVEISSKNKAISLKPIFKILQQNNCIGITPDGPRGPKEIVSEGIIKIANASSVPIIPMGFWSSKNFRLKSWDSFLITLPFSKCSFVWGEPIQIPSDMRKNELKSFQKILEDKLKENVIKAENNCK